jgi:hypothetical protein
MDHRYLAITPTIMCIAFAIAQRSEARVVKLIVEQRNSFVGGADWGNVVPMALCASMVPRPSYLQGCDLIPDAIFTV